MSSSSSSLEAQLLAELQSLTARLRSNDPTLTDFSPTACLNSSSSSKGPAYCYCSSSVLFYLEADPLQQAFSELLAAARHNRFLQTATLHHLPEPELAQAFRALGTLPSLEHVTVRSSNHSTSLSSTVVTQFLLASSCSKKSLLQSLHILPTLRIVVTKQTQLDQLACALQHHHQLRRLQLHILPRCSVQAPTLSLDSVVLACAQLPRLQSLQLQLGYPHNPYGRPMVSCDTLQELLQSRTSALQRLELRNFGLHQAHVQAMAEALKQNNTSLVHLTLSQHPRITNLQSLCDVLETSNRTLQVVQVVDMTTTEMATTALATTTAQQQSQHASLLSRQQRQLDMYGRLNQLGVRRQQQSQSQQQPQDSQHQTAWINAIVQAAAAATTSNDDCNNHNDNSNNDDNDELSWLDVTYWLLRRQPALLATASSSSSSRPNEQGQVVATNTVLPTRAATTATHNSASQNNVVLLGKTNKSHRKATTRTTNATSDDNGIVVDRHKNHNRNNNNETNTPTNSRRRATRRMQPLPPRRWKSYHHPLLPHDKNGVGGDDSTSLVALLLAGARHHCSKNT